MDSLIEFALKVALKLLDLWLDREIARTKLDPKVKQDLALLEDKLMRFLEGPAGQAIGRALAKSVIASRFANDKSTGAWA